MVLTVISAASRSLAPSKNHEKFSEMLYAALKCPDYTSMCVLWIYAEHKRRSLEHCCEEAALSAKIMTSCTYLFPPLAQASKVAQYHPVQPLLSVMCEMLQLQQV